MSNERGWAGRLAEKLERDPFWQIIIDNVEVTLMVLVILTSTYVAASVLVGR